MTVGKRGVTRTIGIPGTGIYNTKTTSFKKSSRGSGSNLAKVDLTNGGTGNTPSQTPPNSGKNKKGCGCAIAGIIVLIAIITVIATQCSGGGKSSKEASSAPVAAVVSSEVSSAPASSAASSAPVSSAASSDVESSAPASSAVPAAAVTSTAPKASGSLTVTKAPGTVAPGSKASVTIKGSPGQSYSIAVHYSSGISKADGLEDKTADSNGNVTWQWEVGPKTKAGTFAVNISGGSQTAATQITVQ